jgi:hypothetical protein
VEKIQQIDPILVQDGKDNDHSLLVSENLLKKRSITIGSFSTESGTVDLETLRGKEDNIDLGDYIDLGDNIDSDDNIDSGTLIIVFYVIDE